MKRVSSADSGSAVGATLVATQPKSRASTLPQQGSLTLWLWVAGGFLLLVLAWSVLFTVARKTKVESVPLTPKEGRP